MYRFPRTRFSRTNTIPKQLLHVVSEVWEVAKALLVGDLQHAVEEIYDAIHSLESLARMLADRGAVVDGIAEQIIEKNSVRGYYETAQEA